MALRGVSLGPTRQFVVQGSSVWAGMLTRAIGAVGSVWLMDLVLRRVIARLSQ